MQKIYIITDTYEGNINYPDRYTKEPVINKIIGVFSTLEKAKEFLLNNCKNLDDSYNYVLSDDGLSAIQTDDTIFLNENYEFDYTYKSLKYKINDLFDNGDWISFYELKISEYFLDKEL